MSPIVKLIYAVTLVFLLLTALGIATGNCSTTQYRPNSLGVSQVYVNNNTYVLGLAVDITMLGDEEYTNVRVKPYNTPMLYDESTLFCGDVRSAFYRPDGKPYTEPMVITYDKIGHHMFRSQACHDLVSAVPVEDSK